MLIVSGWELESKHIMVAIQIVKIEGNYNIVENVLNFADAPIGPTPIGTPTNPPDE